jgi:hypothetical protein
MNTEGLHLVLINTRVCCIKLGSEHNSLFTTVVAVLTPVGTHITCSLFHRDFFLNNQPDSLIIQIYSVIKLFQAESGWKCSILILLGNGHQNLHEMYQCQMYSGKLLMMGREDAGNM